MNSLSIVEALNIFKDVNTSFKSMPVDVAALPSHNPSAQLALIPGKCALKLPAVNGFCVGTTSLQLFPASGVNTYSGLNTVRTGTIVDIGYH